MVQFRVTLGNFDDVAIHARQIAQIAMLAVAIMQAAKNAEHLDVPLHAGEIEPAQKARLIGYLGLPAGVQQALTIIFDPGLDALPVPRDVAVAQQGGQVVGDRTAQRALEIDDAGAESVGDAVAVSGVRAIAQRRRSAGCGCGNRGATKQRGCSQRGVSARGKRRLQHVPFVAGRRAAEVPGQEPFRHQLQFATEKRTVIGGRSCASTTHLHAQQRLQRRRRTARPTVSSCSCGQVQA